MQKIVDICPDMPEIKLINIYKRKNNGTIYIVSGSIGSAELWTAIL